MSITAQFRGHVERTQTIHADAPGGMPPPGITTPRYSSTPHLLPSLLSTPTNIALIYAPIWNYYLQVLSLTLIYSPRYYLLLLIFALIYAPTWNYYPQVLILTRIYPINIYPLSHFYNYLTLLISALNAIYSHSNL